MAKKQLKIRVMPNGEIKMETVGIKGKKCLDYVKLMQDITEAKIEKQELTKEYYEQEEIYQDDVQNIQFNQEG